MVDQILCVMLVGLLLLVQMKCLRHVRIVVRIRLHVQFVCVDKVLYFLEILRYAISFLRFKTLSI